MYFFLLFLCWSVSAAPKSAKYYSLNQVDSYFNEFITIYGKQYASKQEQENRFEIFKTNLEKINQLNNKSQNAVFGITEFMDLTTEEFINTYTGLLVDKQSVTYDICTLQTDENVPSLHAPENWDWRDAGIVTRVKNQESCGSCYAFASTGHIEGQYARRYGVLKEFSEQQIVDCDHLSSGCRGGRPASVFTSYITSLEGAMLEDDYPYIAVQQTCASDPSKVVAVVTACYTYDLSSQEIVKELLYSVGPLPIGVQATTLSGYGGGIISDETCDVGDINHAVLLVGYGSEYGEDYWLIKNSWGTGWGEEGYFRVQRNGRTDGACGLVNRLLATATHY